MPVIPAAASEPRAGSGWDSFCGHMCIPGIVSTQGEEELCAVLAFASDLSLSMETGICAIARPHIRVRENSMARLRIIGIPGSSKPLRELCSCLTARQPPAVPKPETATRDPGLLRRGSGPARRADLSGGGERAGQILPHYKSATGELLGRALMGLSWSPTRDGWPSPDPPGTSSGEPTTQLGSPSTWHVTRRSARTATRNLSLPAERNPSRTSAPASSNHT